MKRKVQKKLRKNKRRARAEMIRVRKKVLMLAVGYGMGADQIAHWSSRRCGKSLANRLLREYAEAHSDLKVAAALKARMGVL
jgi:hypothetical protein